MAAGSELTRLQRTTYGVWLGVGVAVLVGIGYMVLGRPIAIIVPPVLLAIIIVYLLNPAVSGLQRRGVPRWAGTALSYVAVVAILTLSITLLVPPLTSELASFAELAPDMGQRLAEAVNQALAALNLDVRVSESFSGEALATQIQDFVSTAENRTAIFAVVGGISGLLGGILHFVVALVLGPVIAFYLLVDLPRLLRLAPLAVPPARREEAAVVTQKLAFVVGGYVRGQLLVALFVGVASAIGLALIGLPFWLLLGIIAGITNLVPLIGPFVAGALGVAVALVSDGVGLALLVVIVMTAVQQIDSHVLSPLVVGHTVRVHPLLVLFALLVAGTAYGIFGMVVAVPLVAAVKVLLTHAWITRVPWAEGELTGPGEPPRPLPSTRTAPAGGVETPADATAAKAAPDSGTGVHGRRQSLRVPDPDR